MATIRFSGQGTLINWFTPDSLQAQVSDALLAAGWGVTGVALSNYPDASLFKVLFPPANLVPSWNYYIVIDIDNSANQNPEVIKQAVIATLSNWFSNVTLNAINPNSAPVSVFSNLFGGGGSSEIGGISTTTLLIGVAVIMAVMVTLNSGKR